MMLVMYSLSMFSKIQMPLAPELASWINSINCYSNVTVAVGANQKFTCCITCWLSKCWSSPGASRTKSGPGYKQTRSLLAAKASNTGKHRWLNQPGAKEKGATRAKSQTG